MKIPRPRLKKPCPQLMSAGMFPASMASARMFMIPVMMLAVVIAGGVRVKVKGSLKKCFYRLISRTRDAGVELNTCFRKCCARAAADAAADQGVHTVFRQKSCQCAVAASVGIHDRGACDLLPPDKNFPDIVCADDSRCNGCFFLCRRRDGSLRLQSSEAGRPPGPKRSSAGQKRRSAGQWSVPPPCKRCIPPEKHLPCRSAGSFHIRQQSKSPDCG